jgi:ring-1,2-phenylacetyl-CoA epoxidase subunit PaaA
MTIPDSDLAFNEETGHWTIGEIDWDEFWRTIKGDGRLNRERITHKVKAWEDGRWVRDAATAYAAKQKMKLDKSA